MRDLDPVYDGEPGPIRRFQLDDGGSPVDLNMAAVEIYVYDKEDNFIARRVGVPVSPKTDGYVDLMFLGREIDWDGAGKELVLRPKIYAAIDPNGDPATNVLLNSSFDTDSNADGVPDNWSLQGVSAATWQVRTDDPYPSVIFGGALRTFHGSLGQSDYIQQSANVTLAAGDPLSVGCWHRVTGTTQSEGDQHAIFFRRNLGANSYARFRATARDWYFVTGTLIVDVAQSSALCGVDARGTTLDNRYDDIYLFRGTWRQIPSEALRVEVRPRSRPAKTTNQVAGVGSFEYDSDADGFADGWSKANASGVSFAHEKDPTNVYVGSASQKITMSNHTGKKIELVKRGTFAAGTWRVSVRMKTNGSLGGSPTGGQWGIRLEADEFTDDVLIGLGAASDFGLSNASFLQYTNDLILSAESSALKVAIYLNGVTGDAWIDDVQLWRAA
jgi:hypothetical protein